MPQPDATPFVSRGGEKLAHALNTFSTDVKDKVCADLGCHVGGFTDCLLGQGAAKVYAVDTSYGVLAWKLRKDPRVIVMERANAMHVELPEAVDLITIDVGWTRQGRILPRARKIIAPHGKAVTLIKPQYEAEKSSLRGGVLPDQDVARLVEKVLADVPALGWRVEANTDSPIRGHGGNREVFALLTPA